MIMVEKNMAFEEKTKSRSFLKSSFGMNSTGNQFLLFSIKDDSFAIPVDIVNQIEFYDSSKKVPGSPSYVLGITKLRERIVTIIHLANRLKIHSEPPKKDQQHVIFVEKGQKIIGMLVDRVSNIINIPKNQIKDDVEIINTNIPLDFLKGVATVGDKIVVIINTDLILSNFVTEELSFKNERFKRELGDTIHSSTGQVNYDDFEDSLTREDDDLSYETDDSLTDELYDTEEEDSEENFDDTNSFNL